MATSMPASNNPDPPDDLSVDNIELRFLIVDSRFQRPLNKNFVKRIVANYDPRKMLPLEVNWRETDVFSVLDGQTRLAAARELGIPSLLCRIHVGLTLEEEAKQHDSINHDRSGQNSVDRYRSHLVSGDPPDARLIDAIIRRYGYHVARNGNSPDCFQAVGALRDAYRLVGPVTFEQTIRTLRSAWPGDLAARSADIVGGVADFLGRYGGVKEAELVRKLRAESPGRIVSDAASVARARHVGTGSRNRARIASEAVWALYNRGRRTGRLPNLYPHGSDEG